MALRLENLTDEVRRIMLVEIDRDISTRRLCLSECLSAIGQLEYPSLLKEAAQTHDSAWLSAELDDRLRLNQMEGRRRAAEALAEGEINRFYIRALCQKAVSDGIDHLIICRARQVSDPRADAEAMIGTAISPVALYADLWKNIDVDTALSLPPGLNSGLSVRLP